MPDEVTAYVFQSATQLHARATIAAALVTTDNLDPVDVNMSDNESMRIYAAKLSDTIDLVMKGVTS
jgi:hypothetical protein